MKKNCFLLGISVFVLSFQTNAQTSLNPNLVTGCKGSWLFDNTENVWADGSGGNPLVPKGTAPTSISGPLTGDKAILLSSASAANYLEMNSALVANGGTKVNAYTLVFDISLVTATGWKSLWSSQATLTGGTFSGSDATMFIKSTGIIGNGALGTLSSQSATGYITPALVSEKWYRVAFVGNLPTDYKIYIDGVLVATRTGGPAIDNQFALNAGASPNFIFGDNDGDNDPLRCAGVAVWDKALSAIEIASLGSLSAPVAVAPTAAFTANSSSIFEGAAISYNDESTQNPSSWAWTFEGGIPATSTLQNPTVLYSTAGTYTASLKATNGAGSSTVLTKTNYVTVITGGSTLVPNKPIYLKNEDITVAFTGATTNLDWIGIYQLNQLPGATNATLWNYLNGTQSSPAAVVTNGAITFVGGLPTAGDYILFLLANDASSIDAIMTSKVFSISTATSIDKTNSSDFKCNIYPTSTRGIYNVTFASKLDGKGNISVVDISGKIIVTKNYNSFNVSEIIDLQNVANGIYFVKLQIDGTTLLSKKISVNK